MEKCLTTLAKKEIQIKTTLRFHLAPVSTAFIKEIAWTGGVAQVL
jgi:hypothetical protein